MFELSSLHQKIIHFPIAFIVVYPFFEIAALIKKSDFNDKVSIIVLTLGIFGLVSALISGNYVLSLYQNLNDIKQEIVNQHIEFANYTAWFSGILFLSRIYLIKKIKLSVSFRIIIILLSVITLYFVIKTVEFGGKTNRIITIHQNLYKK